MDNFDTIRRAQGIMKIAILIGVLALFMSVVKNIVTERWLKQKNTVACVPSDVEHSLPIVYHQTALHPVQNDGLVKTFAEEYIRLTQNEQIVSYHQLSQNQRYANAQLSQDKWKAIEMSVQDERALNMQKYADSNKMFYILEQGKMGWVFLIDDILLFPLPESGATLAVIRGEFQATADKVKVDTPHFLWGYREIHLMILQGVPTSSTKDQDVNKYGLYVAWSNMNTLTQEQKDKFAQRNYDHYLTKENE